MPDFGPVTQLGPYHVLFYGTALGTSIFQSFVGGIVAFKSLPRPSFSTLQQAIFPIYFGMETILPAAMALTFPGSGSTLSRSAPVSLSGVLEPQNRWSVLLPIGTAFLTSLVNWTYLGPEATRVMIQRKHQETRDGKKSYDAGPHSEAMKQLNKRFGMLHGVSTLVNLVGLVALIRYGFHIGARLDK